MIMLSTTAWVRNDLKRVPSLIDKPLQIVNNIKDKNICCTNENSISGLNMGVNSFLFTYIYRHLFVFSAE